jgi:stage V sporulation protein D (sporulation-specific penicillin-binding protein)
MMEGRNGTIIAMDPRDGRVHAVVNEPLAFGQAFPAGSAIKIFTALAALETGLIDRAQTIRCRGKYQFQDFSIFCSHPRDNPDMDLVRALAYSCNYYFATLGERLDAESFKRYLEGFGFGTPTGIDYPDEATGRMAIEQEEIRARAAIGESRTLLVTPIQLLTAFCAVINGGRLLRPHRRPLMTPELRSALPLARSFTVINDALAAGAAFGTSARASVSGLDLVGKTGTPTVLAVKDKTHAWFLGAAPREAPELAVLVFIGRGRGGLNGAPMAAKVFATYFAAEAR